jgi:3-isopropylmalate/(R)-2-methylmalate dehydratase small subunit
MQVCLDLPRQELSWKGTSCRFPIESFAKQCLLHGVDELGYILRFNDDIAAFEARSERGRGS